MEDSIMPNVAPPAYAPVGVIDFAAIAFDKPRLINWAGALPDLSSTLEKLDGKRVDLSGWTALRANLQAQIKKDELIFGSVMATAVTISIFIAFLGSALLCASMGPLGIAIGIGSALLISLIPFVAVVNYGKRLNALTEIIAAAHRQLQQE